MNFINSGNYSHSLLAYMLFEECYWGRFIRIRGKTGRSYAHGGQRSRGAGMKT